MPSWVDFVVYGQFALFSFFGVVPSVQAYFVFAADHTDASCPTDRMRWALAAKTYSVLSVVAKSMLEFGFLALIETLPRVE